MNENHILRYLDLVNRRLKILLCGKNWKTEYDAELEAIDLELAQLRKLIDAEHKKREQAAE